MATNKKLEAGVTYGVKGKLAVYKSSSKGWHTFTLDNGSTIKARGKDIRSASTAGDGNGRRKFRVYDEDGNAKVSYFDMEKYTRHKDVSTEGGNFPLDVSDAAADALRGEATTEMYNIVTAELVKIKDELYGKSKTGIKKELVGRYAKHNEGQQRMFLGNVLRGAWNRANPQA